MKNSFLLFLLLLVSGFLALLLESEKEPESKNRAQTTESPLSSSSREPILEITRGTPPVRLATQQAQQQGSLEDVRISMVKDLNFPQRADLRMELTKDAHSTPESFRNFAQQMAPLMEASLSEITIDPRKVSPLLRAVTQRLSDCAEGENAVEYPVRALCWYNLKRIAHASSNPQLRKQIVQLESQLPMRVRRLASRI